jgi:ATP:ADP antiporter, AAA family
MIGTRKDLSPLERVLALFTRLRPGEGVAVLLFTLYAFLLLTSYYVLKTIREALMLTEHSAEVRAYAVGATALVLLFTVPVYGLLFRHTRKITLVQWITLFFVVNTAMFWALAKAGVEVGFFYFVWVGIFGIMAPAQFWAFAADSVNVKTGQRLFPLIMVGATAGAVAGAQLARLLTRSTLLEPVDLLLVGGLLLGLTLALCGAARERIPADSRAVHFEDEDDDHDDRLRQFLGGFALVARDRYLALIALLVVLLNWVNSTGETILAWFVRAQAQIAAPAAGITTGQYITAFYGGFFFWVNLISFLVQAFLVARIYRWIGVAGALLILPAIAAAGYGLVAFVPIFSIIHAVKLIENSTDYSVMNTTRQAIFLPLGRAGKYEGKTAIDTFFWRFGDLVQAGAFFVGIRVFGLEIPQFAFVNLVLALAWLGLAVVIARDYRVLARRASTNHAPELGRPVPDAQAAPGQPVLHQLAPDTFLDRDPGDILTLSAALAGGRPLPSWLRFDPDTATFQGRVPNDVAETLTEVEVRATDFEGLSVATRFRFMHRRN